MNAGAIIFALLADSTQAAKRIYPQILPQQPTYPAVTYQQISSTRLRAMGKDDGLVRVRVQVNCWGRTYAEAHTLAGEVEGLLNRHRGTVAGATVLDCLLDNELEQYEMESNTRRVIQDYTLYFQA